MAELDSIREEQEEQSFGGLGCMGRSVSSRYGMERGRPGRHGTTLPVLIWCNWDGYSGDCKWCALNFD